MRWILGGAIAILLALAGLQTTTAHAQTVSTVSGSALNNLILYYSNNAPATYNNQYVGFRVVNNSTAREALWVKVANVTGGNVTLASGETSERNVGAVAGGASKTVYFLFRANSATTTPTTFDILLYEGAPSAGGTLISTTAARFSSVSGSQNASANKVTGGFVNPTAPSLGSEFQVVLTGLTGQMSNANGTAIFTPAFAQGWDPSAFELVSTNLDFAFNGANNRSFDNQLFFPVSNNGTTAGEINNNGGAYTATYTFRAVNRTSASVRPTPVGHIKSGNIWKYTNASSLSSIAPIEPVTNSFLITAEAAPTKSKDGYFTYILTLANTSTRTLSVDLVRDVLPTGAAYQAGTSTYNGTAIPNPTNSSGNLAWSGPFTIAGGARATLSYQVYATPTATATEYSNSATGLVGATVIDTTLDTTDDRPAVATATVDTGFVADTDAPTITLSATDGTGSALTGGGTTSSTAATMTFSANESSAFTCSLDGAAPSTCTSPQQYSNLAAGSHTFWVYAKDDAGNIGSASLTWTVINTSKPEVARFQPSVSSSKTSPLSFSLEFTKDIVPSSLIASDLTVVTTGSPGTWTISSILGSGSSYLVTLTSASPGTSGTVGLRLAADSVTDAADATRTGPTSTQASGTVTMSNTTDVEITGATPAAGSTSNATTATFSFGPPAGAYPPDQYKCMGPGESSFSDCVSPVTYTGITDGAKTFSVKGELVDANDAVTFTTATRTSTWTVDATPPAVTLTTPSAALLTGPTPTLSGACTATDGSVTAKVFAGASATGTPVQELTAACAAGTWDVDAATLADGQYTARAQQTDGAGNVGASSARTFTIDSTPPVATVLADTASTTTGSASFTVSFSEPVTGFSASSLIIGGTSSLPSWTATTVAPGSGNTYAVTLTTASAPGIGTLTLQVGRNAVTDTAGNSGPSSDSAAATMNVTATDDLTGGAVVANNGNAWGARRTLPVSPTNFTSMSGNPSNNLFRIAAAWVDGECGAFGATETSVSLDEDSDDPATLADGCYRYILRANNGSKSASTQSNTVKLDLTQPTLGDLAVEGGTGQLTRQARPSIAKGDKADGQSGLKASAEKFSRASATFSAGSCDPFPTYDPDAATETAVVPDGAGKDPNSLASACYRYTHRVGDNAGNTTDKAATVKVDVNAPTGGQVTANGGTDTWTKDAKPALARTAVADAHSGLKASGGDTFTRAFAAFNADGDCAGVTHAGADAVTIDGNGRDAHAGTLAEGCYLYTSAAEDNAGNTTEHDATVKIDRTPPAGGTVSAPEWKRTLPAIGGSGFGDVNSGVASQALSREAASLSGATCDTSWTSDGTPALNANGEDTAALAQGCYRYVRSATDRAGNTAASAPAIVKIDTTAPVSGTITAPAWKRSDPAIGGTSFQDDNSGIDSSDATAEVVRRARAPLDGTNCPADDDAAWVDQQTVTLVGGADTSDLSQACYRYVRTATDRVGNSAATPAAIVRIDTTKPAGASITANAGREWTNATQPELAGDPFSDANSGIATQALRRQSATLNGSGCDNDWTALGASPTVTVSGGADAATLGQGCYRYVRTATDNVGNDADAVEATVKIDRTPPSGGTIAVARTGGNWANTPRPAITGDPFTDANSDIDSRSSVTRIVRERAEYVAGGNTCSETWVVDKDPVTVSGGRDADELTEACYRYVKVAGDNAGNTADTPAEAVQMDLTGPVGGAVEINGGTDVDGTAGTPPTITLEPFTDRLSGLAAGSERLTRRIAPWVGSAAGAAGRGGARIASRSEFGDFGTPEPVTLFGDEDPEAVTPGRYLYEYEATDTAGNVTTREALIEIRPADYVPPADPTPVVPGTPTEVTTPKLRLGLGLPESVQRALQPFGGRIYVSNPGTAITRGIEVKITPPDGVLLVSAKLAGARSLEHSSDACRITGGVMTCTIAELAPGSARPINLGIVGQRAGMKIVLKSFATATNVPGVTESDDIVIIGGDPCRSAEPEDQELCQLTQSLRPAVTTKITVSRRRVPSGGSALVTVRITNRSGVTGPMRVAIPLRGFMRPAIMPKGAKVARGILTIPVRSLEANQGDIARVAMRMTSPTTVTKRVRAVVAVPALKGIRLTSTPVTITPGGVTGVTG
jgi:hypothetical protein